MIENSTSLLQEITNVINKEEIVNLNLTEGKEYLITFVKQLNIYILHLTFCLWY